MAPISHIHGPPEGFFSSLARAAAASNQQKSGSDCRSNSY
ncbi:hypothetical protein CCACVL1_08341 [Corchorus capsularis]|uniref:Uncharacterized protein n=1 Tax=Corchorus capsularis TaxID=210143 RepID=A0A1R3J123_COCAP|nr:hypothetical protein CCACVL1_08341 [Corchorus capsularis]